VDIGAIGLRDAGVASDHLQVGVAKESLESEHVTLITHVGDSESVAEAMGEDVGHAGTLTDALKQQTQVGTSHLAWIVLAANQEEVVLRVGYAKPGHEISPDGLGGAPTEVNDALFAALADNFDTVGLDVELSDLDVAKLGSSHAGV
jgi:hypothetical protein